MKTIYQKMSIALLAALALCLSACVDDGYDLGNASTAFQWEGALGLPVVAESTVTIEQLVNKIKIDEDAQAKIIIDENGVLCLQFDTALVYHLPKINQGFKDFGVLFENLKILDGAVGSIQNASGNYFTTIACDLYDRVNGGENADKHRINRIQFSNTDITLGVSLSGITFSPGGSLEAKVELPQKNGSPQYLTFNITGNGDVVLQNQNFTIDLEALHIAGDVLNVELTATNATVDGSASITASLTLDPADGEFVAYGYFNYVLVGNQQDFLKVDDYAADIYGDLKDIEKNLHFTDTRFEFDIESTFGVPLEFYLEDISAIHKEGTSEQSTIPYTLAAGFVPNFYIDRAAQLHQTAKTAPIKLDKTKITTIEDLVTTDLSRVHTEHTIITHEINDLNNPGVPEQFISSKDSIVVRAKTTIPCTLKQGDYITYSDTLTLNADSIDLGDGWNLSKEEVLLRIQFNNQLPLPVEVTTKLAMKVGDQYVLVAPAVAEEFKLKAKQQTTKNYPYTIDKLNQWLGSEKALILEYKMPPLPSNASVVKGDFISVRVGVAAKGKIIGEF